MELFLRKKIEIQENAGRRRHDRPKDPIMNEYWQTFAIRKT